MLYTSDISSTGKVINSRKSEKNLKHAATLEDISICGICNQQISNKDCRYLSYGCSNCPAWIHAKCIFAGANKDELQTIFKFHRAFDVKCNGCRQALKKDTTDSQISQQVRVEVNACLPTLVAEVVKSCQSSIQANHTPVNESVNVSFAQIMKDQKAAINDFQHENTQKIENIADTVSNIRQKLNNSQIVGDLADKSEKEDRNRRRNNMIMFNLPESDDGSANDQMMQDCSKLLKLMDGAIKLTQDQVVKIFRLGKRQKRRGL